MSSVHHMPFGAELGEEGTRFRLWAPSAKRVVLKAESPGRGLLQADLNQEKDGWFEMEVAGLGAGTRYSYSIDDAIDVPDPAARFNPEGVQKASEVVDPRAFEWRDSDWSGRDWHEAVVYELHIGTFTAEGTYAAAISRLDELRDLGITALELLPLAAFAGHHGWGYDGVLQYAPHAPYGRPEDLKQFVQAAHERELMVLLDVVYNHFGPEGNYLPRYAHDFFSARHQTPWGGAIDFSRPTVRQFFIQNALYWLNEYRFDGLRIDAVHAMHDDSPVHFIDELVDTVRNGPGRKRRVHVVLENHRNEASHLRMPSSARGSVTAVSVAQWNDDFHHPLHVLLTGECDGYYCDYADEPIAQLGRVLAEGFAFQGEKSTFSGEPRGERSVDLPPTAFVNFLQNHDQIGNRALGERMAQLAPLQQLRAALTIQLLSPQVPMLFMGEEYAAPQPFLYFCDYQGDLARAVTEGRRAEFSGFRAFADEAGRSAIPDPNAAETYERSRLDWTDRQQSLHAEQLAFTRDLLRVRAQRIVPLIPQIAAGKSTFDVDGHLLTVRWATRSGEALIMYANLGADEAGEVAEGEPLFPTGRGDGKSLRPWEVRLLLQKS